MRPLDFALLWLHWQSGLLRITGLLLHIVIVFNMSGKLQSVRIVLL